MKRDFFDVFVAKTQKNLLKNKKILPIDILEIYFFIETTTMFITKEIVIKTKSFFDIHDITDQVKEFVKEHKIINGLVNVFTRHTTAVLKINEAEDGLRRDLKIWAEKVVPMEARYHHNDLPNRDPKTMCSSKEECLNGHSHISSMLLGVSSETIPVQAGEMLLGVRQRLLLIEMDHARERTIILSFIGE